MIGPLSRKKEGGFFCIAFTDTSAKIQRMTPAKKHEIYLGMMVHPDRITEAVRCLSTLRDDITSATILVKGDPTEPVASYDILRAAVDGHVQIYSEPGDDPDFAKCRNKTLPSARDGWYLWADSDDILENPGSLQQAIEDCPDEVNIIETTYITGGVRDGMNRERLVRSRLFQSADDSPLTGAHARWVMPLHEYIQIDPPHNTAINDPNIIWRHKPTTDRATSRTRNRRILTKALGKSDELIYHYAEEAFLDGDLATFKTWAGMAIAYPGINDSLKYRLMLQMGTASETSTEARHWYGRAISVIPYAREAYAALAENEMQSRKPDRLKLQSFISHLHVSPPQMRQNEVPLYTDRSLFGWRGLDYWERAQRVFGDINQDAINARAKLAKGAVKILLSHATYNRPQMCVQTRNNWINSASNPYRVIHVFGIEKTDTDTELMTRGMARVTTNARASVAAWNAACEHPEAKDCQIIVQLSDDWDCFPGWDDAIEARLDITKERALHINDGCRPDTDWLMCMPIITRKRYEAHGWLLHPDYKSIYSDTDFSVRSYYDKIVIQARDLLFQHRHPLFGHGEDDITYAHGNDPERYEAGRKTFMRLVGDKLEKLGWKV